MLAIGQLFDRLWADYTRTTPQALRVHKLLAARGERPVNDHIALRTFAHPACDIEVLDRAFVADGYVAMDSYEFPGDKLHAYHYEHPSGELPKVFISALLLDECSPKLREIVDRLVAELPAGASAKPFFAASGRVWDLDFATYEALRDESQYAAWVAAFGFRANHFTVDAASLKSFAGLAELNAYLQESGFQLNDAGGTIKGSPELHLEQSSTRAEEVEVAFADGRHHVPSGYVEFARRYPLPSGEIFQGFLRASAQKLFRSTDAS